MTYAERNEIEAEAPDVVIVATGSFPREDGWQSNLPHLRLQAATGDNVYSSRRIFEVVPERLGRSAVIYDDAGRYEAVGVAEYLVSCGLAVTFVTRHAQFLPIGWRTLRLEPVLRRLEKGMFRLIPNANVAEIGNGTADILRIGTPAPERVEADTVVLISGNLAFDELYTTLHDRRNDAAPCELKRIGDALSPRDLQAAIAKGHMTARAIT